MKMGGGGHRRTREMGSNRQKSFEDGWKRTSDTRQVVINIKIVYIQRSKEKGNRRVQTKLGVPNIWPMGCIRPGNVFNVAFDGILNHLKPTHIVLACTTRFFYKKPLYKQPSTRQPKI